MSGTDDAGKDPRARARCLAFTQCSDYEIAAALAVEQSTTYQAIWPLVEEMSEELVTCRHYGRAKVRERTYGLATGTILDKVTGASLSAMDTFGQAYLGLGEREDIRKLVEKTEREMAKGNSGPKLVSSG
jgi:hypothetical protein